MAMESSTPVVLTHERKMQALLEKDASFDGLFYSCVKTTGIYCRPSCRYSPLPENVTFAASPAEAERNGYRPCKSCFPDLPTGRWLDRKQDVLLQTPREFCFAECLAFLSRSANECTHEVREGAVWKALKVDGVVVVFRVGVVEADALTITFLTPPPKKSIRAAVARYVWDWFDLGTDLRPFYRMAENDRLLKPLAEAHFGLRLLGYPDLFEAVTWAFIGQQVNLAFAYTLKRRLVETFGEQVQHEGHTYWLFPTPEALANATVEELTALKLIRQRAEYVIGFAKLMAEGRVSKASLLRAGATDESGDIDAMRNALRSIRGVGPWTAEYVLMKCLKQRTAFPVQDAALQNAIKMGLALAEKPLQATIRHIAAGWAGWESYATFYLWRSLLKIDDPYEKINKIVKDSDSM